MQSKIIYFYTEDRTVKFDCWKKKDFIDEIRF